MADAGLPHAKCCDSDGKQKIEHVGNAVCRRHPEQRGKGKAYESAAIKRIQRKKVPKKEYGVCKCHAGQVSEGQHKKKQVDCRPCCRAECFFARACISRVDDCACAVKLHAVKRHMKNTHCDKVSALVQRGTDKKAESCRSDIQKHQNAQKQHKGRIDFNSVPVQCRTPPRHPKQVRRPLRRHRTH